MAGCRYAPNNKPSMGALNNGVTLAVPGGLPPEAADFIERAMSGDAETKRILQATEYDSVCASFLGTGAVYGSNRCIAEGGAPSSCPETFDPGCLLRGHWMSTNGRPPQRPKYGVYPVVSDDPAPAQTERSALTAALPLAAAAALLYLWRK